MSNVISFTVADESSSSTESSSVSSDSSTDSDEDSELGDTKLLLEIRNKLKNIEKAKQSPKTDTATAATAETKMESPQPEVIVDVPKSAEPVQKRKREGLVQEIIISVSS